MNELTSVQREFLKILESFMHDSEYRLPEQFEEIEALFQMAQVHKMTAAVYEQIRANDICKKSEYQNLLTVWKRMAIRDVMMQVQKAEAVLSVYQKMCDAGLKPLIVKGAVCRKLYCKSDYRVSSDEDILLPRKDFEKCDTILLQEGFKREELNLDELPHEIPYMHPAVGAYIELHFSLFPEESGAYGHLNDEFQNVFEHSIYEEVQGKKVWTLNPTEHLFYLICHSFKHFLHGGFGLRQVSDMMMMAEHYGAQIDWNLIQEKIGRLNMELYWKALVKIGAEYLGFSVEKAAYPESMQTGNVDCQPILMDLLDSGIYGNSSAERKHSSNMTLAAVAGGKANTAASIKASLFPQSDYMKKSFPWLKKYPLLLPIAYGIRIVRYLKSPKEKDRDGQNSVQIGMERVELLRKYHIIE